MIEQIPILIGVTGHIDIPEQNIYELKNQIRAIFEKVKKKYSNSPIAVFSPLAEGADRIVAQVALEYNAKLIIPLPMPKESYLKDFTSDSSIKEFEELCSKAEQIFTLSLVEGNTIDNISDYGPARDKQYEQVGLYLIKKCQFLIALWDGIDLNKTGGTSCIVNFAINGFVDSYNSSLVDAPYNCPVYHILTPRKQHKDLSVEIKSEFLYPALYEDETANKDILDSILKKTANLNKDIIEHFGSKTNKYLIEIKQSQSYLLPESDTALLNENDLKILKFYSVFDVLSGIYQRNTKDALRGLIILALLAIIAFDLYAHLGHVHNPSFIILSLIFILIGYIIFKVSEIGDLQGKYLDYRAVTEGLRVQFFWQLSKINEDISNYYLLKQKTELQWIRSVVQYINLGINENIAMDNKVYDYNLVIKNWVEDQFKFFKNKVKHNKNRKELFENLIRAFLWGSVVLSIMLIFPLPFTYIDEHIIEILLIFVATLLPALAAAFEFYSQKMAYKAQKIRYFKAEELFRKVHNRLKEALKLNNIDEFKKIIKKLGEESLFENGDWLAIHRERPIEMPNLK